MTNAMIIFWQSVELMNAGLLNPTGRVLTVQLPDGSMDQVQEPEPIHTFACWKGMGFSVKKGEKAIARFPIWKGSEKVLKDDDGNDTDEKELKMFRKEACFFKASQVEPTDRRKPSEDRPRRRRTPINPPMVPDLPVPAPDAGYGNWLN